MSEDGVKMTLGTTTPAPNMERVLVVDDDDTMLRLVAAHLQGLGYQEVECFSDGESAWAAMVAKPFSLLISDWKLPGMSGLTLFNRLRSHRRYRHVPVLVISGFLERNDFRLLQEFALTNLLEKPFSKNKFETTLKTLHAERLWYKEHQKLMEGLFADSSSDGLKNLERLIASSPNPTPVLIMAARYLAKHQQFAAAEKCLRQVLDSDPESILALNELGKLLFRSGDTRGARDALRIAQRFSPQNFQRLCLLGEVELNLSEPEAARRYFDQALQLDPESKKARAGKTLAENAMSVQVTAGEQISHSFASMLNTVGVALVRSGRIDKGIEQYQASLAFIRDNNNAARVAFNVGLGYLRSGQPHKALPWFQKSDSLAPGEFRRSENYVRELTRQRERAKFTPAPPPPAPAAAAPATRTSGQEYVPGMGAPSETPDLASASPAEGAGAQPASDDGLDAIDAALALADTAKSA